MVHLPHVDPVVVLMRADPLDPDDALLEVNRRDQPVVVALDVEDHTLGGHEPWNHSSAGEARAEDDRRRRDRACKEFIWPPTQTAEVLAGFRAPVSAPLSQRERGFRSATT